MLSPAAISAWSSRLLSSSITNTPDPKATSSSQIVLPKVQAKRKPRSRKPFATVTTLVYVHHCRGEATPRFMVQTAAALIHTWTAPAVNPQVRAT